VAISRVVGGCFEAVATKSAAIAVANLVQVSKVVAE
jgi:hypothetical protein